MPGHLDCHNWDYESHPKARSLKARCDRLTALVATYPKRFARYGYDTRAGHRFMFAKLAPPACTCLVGRYRGEKSCAPLVSYEVRVRGIKAAGFDAAYVEMSMKMFEDRCQTLFAAYSARLNQPGADEGLAFALLIDVLADLLVVFFNIHPYANGNGHAGRLFVWVLLARHGFVPQKWSVDAKQPYGKVIDAHRAGDEKPLQLFLAKLAR